MKFSATKSKSSNLLAETCRTCKNDFAFWNYTDCRDCGEPVCKPCYKEGVGRCQECQEKFVDQLAETIKNDEGYQAIARITDRFFIMEQEQGTAESKKQYRSCVKCESRLPGLYGYNECKACLKESMGGCLPTDVDDQLSWGKLNCPPGKNGHELETSVVYSDLGSIYRDVNEGDFLRAEALADYSDYELEPAGGVEI